MREPRREEPETAERIPAAGGDGGLAMSWSPKKFLGGALLGVGILGGGLTGYLLADGRRTRVPAEAATRSEVATATPRQSVESQIAARRLAVFTEAELSPTAPPQVVSSEFMPIITLTSPYEVVDAALFDAGERRIRLARILPVGRQEVCFDTDGRRFACGLMGRAALQNLLARRSVTCAPLFVPRPVRLDHVEADCSIDGSDVAEHMVRAGFAFPAPLAGGRLTAALDEARRSRAGVWSGPYLVPETDHTIEDSRATGTLFQRTSPPEGHTLDAPAEDRAAIGSIGMQNGPAQIRKPVRREVTAPTKSRPPATDAPRLPSPAAAARQPPYDRGPGPAPARETPRPGVVAGPILPPSEALARKLGVSTSTTAPSAGDNGRGSSDR